jgi:hypothetical protein
MAGCPDVAVVARRGGNAYYRRTGAHGGKGTIGTCWEWDEEPRLRGGNDPGERCGRIGGSALPAIVAQTGGGDVVDVPTSDDDGLGAHASIVLGPGIPVMATNAPADALEDDDRDFVEEITGRVAVAMKGVPSCGCGC